MHLQEYKEQFNQYFAEVIKNGIPKNDNELIKSAYTYCLDLFADSGKRLRPYLIYLACLPKSFQESIQFAVAVELIHSFALVHDDIMDKCDYRRGQLSMHKFLEKNSDAHIAQSLSILIGDHLFSLAEGEFSKPSELKSNQARLVFQQLKSEVMLGQMMDMEFRTRTEVGFDEIIQKTNLKTASYSVTKPLQIGFALSNQNHHQFAQEFGYNLGLAFQIQDDLLNLTAPKEQTGKDQFSDIEEGEHTVFTHAVMQSEFQEEFLELFGKPLTDPEMLTQILEESKALEFGQNLIDEHFGKAQKALDSFDGEAKPYLQEITDYLKQRKS